MDVSQLSSLASAAPGGSNAEAQIRSLMAMVKQMNDKHPDLLAKIWEEERQQHIENTNSPATKPAQQTAETSNSSQKKKRAPKKTATAQKDQIETPSTTSAIAQADKLYAAAFCHAELGQQTTCAGQLSPQECSRSVL